MRAISAWGLTFWATDYRQYNGRCVPTSVLKVNALSLFRSRSSVGQGGTSPHKCWSPPKWFYAERIPTSIFFP